MTLALSKTILADREPAERGYAAVETVAATMRLQPRHAPAAFGFVLDDLGRP